MENVKFVLDNTDIARMLDDQDRIIVFKDKFFRYEAVNKRFLEFYGLSVKEVIGKTFRELFLDKNPHSWRAESDDLECYHERKLVKREIKLRGARESLWFELVRVPRYDHEGNVIGIYLSAYSIDDKIRSREKILTLQLRLLSKRQKIFVLKDADFDVSRKEIAQNMYVQNSSIDSYRSRVRRKLKMNAQEYNAFIEQIKIFFDEIQSEIF